MHFCFTAQYTPHSLNAIMDNPTTSRYEATKKLVEAAGGKLISMYSTGADGPGVLIISTCPTPMWQRRFLASEWQAVRFRMLGLLVC